MKEEVILSYYGPFLQENIEGMGKVLRKKLQQMEMEFSVMQAVFSVYVEVCHNILHHSSQHQIGGLEIRCEEDTIVIESRNCITTQQKEGLKKRLEHLNRLDKVQLRQAYLEQRKKEGNQREQSAGLGLIEIAKRSMGPLEYQFEQEGSQQVFHLFIRIGGKLRCIV